MTPGAGAPLGHGKRGLLAVAFALPSFAAIRHAALAVPRLPEAAMVLHRDIGCCLMAAGGLVLACLIYVIGVVAWLAWGCGAFLNDPRR